MQGLFGKPKVQGPDPATVAAQQAQDKRLREQEVKQQREAGSRSRIIEANKAGPVTLFQGAPSGGKAGTLGGG